MQRFVITALLVLIILAACTDHSYRGAVDDPAVISETMPVQIVVGNPDNNIIVKGSGALDSDKGNVWDDARIYLYGFKRDLYTRFDVTSIANGEICLIDGSRDELGSEAGKRAKVGLLDSYIAWDGVERAVYYPAGNIPYDIYAYYLDDYKVEPETIVRKEDCVQMVVEIDGARDIMSSKAELTEDQLYRSDLTDEDRFNIINYSYSSFTASKNIYPILLFKHHLSRLCFDMYPGREESDNIYLDSVKVLSRTKAVFTVAHKASENMGLDFSDDAEYKLLTLRDDNGGRLEPGVYHTEYDGSFDIPLYERDHVRVGGSLLVAPDEEYEVHLYFTEHKPNSVKYNYENVMKIKTSEGGFRPGQQYAIRLGIYGMMEVSASVGLEPWGDGGNLIVDEDRPPVEEK